MRWGRLVSLFCTVLVAAALAENDLFAKEPSEKSTPTESPRLSLLPELALTAGFIGSAVLGRFVRESPPVSFTAVPGFDREIGRLRVGNDSARKTVGRISDALQIGLAAYPIALVTTKQGLLDQEWAGSWESNLINLQAYGFSIAFIQFSKRIAGRPRPSAQPCEGQDGYRCLSSSKKQGFISGHTAAAFTGASLGCFQHERLSVFSKGGHQRLACTGLMALAATDGVLRILADAHYATDVLAGAAAGIVAGYLLPSLLHSPAPNRTAALSASLFANLDGGSLGAGAEVSFRGFFPVPKATQLFLVPEGLVRLEQQNSNGRGVVNLALMMGLRDFGVGIEAFYENVAGPDGSSVEETRFGPTGIFVLRTQSRTWARFRASLHPLGSENWVRGRARIEVPILASFALNGETQSTTLGRKGLRWSVGVGSERWF